LRLPLKQAQHMGCRRAICTGQLDFSCLIPGQRILRGVINQFSAVVEGVKSLFKDTKLLVVDTNMARFSDQDKLLLYIIRRMDVGSWDDCTRIFNHLATEGRTQDGLTAAYRSIHEDKKLEVKARTTAGDEIRKQIRECLRTASRMHHSWKRNANESRRKKAFPGMI